MSIFYCSITQYSKYKIKGEKRLGVSLGSCKGRLIPHLYMKPAPNKIVILQGSILAFPEQQLGFEIKAEHLQRNVIAFYCNGAFLYYGWGKKKKWEGEPI